MSIRTDIIATDPWLYWPLDDGTLTDIGSNAHAASLSGGTDLTATGIEKGKTALHLDSTGAITSDVLGLNTASDFSMSCYGMMAPIAGWNAFRDLMTIGSRGGTIGVNRGGSLGLNGVSGGQPNPVGGAWPSTIFASGPAVNQPYNFWHHFAMVYNQTTRLVTCYTDGVAATGTTMNAAMGAFGASDRMVFSWSSGQFVVAHVAFWRFQLTTAQIAAFGGYASNWPQNQDFQTGGTSGGGGGLTTDQDAKLTQISLDTQQLLANWSGYTSTTLPSLEDMLNSISSKVDSVKTDTFNIVNSLFPELADFLNTIMNGITGVIGSGADAVSQTVGQIVSWISSSALVTGVVAGPTCDPIDWDVPTALWLYGIELEITSWPSEWTFTTPDDDYSIRDLAVINITIGVESIRRYGVHNKKFEISPMPGIWYPPVAIVATVPFVPPGYHIRVDFAGGVCGQLHTRTKP